VDALKEFPNAKLIKKITYTDVIAQNLKVMDLSAIALANENKVKLRIFNMFKEESLITAFNDKSFGSTVELAE